MKMEPGLTKQLLTFSIPPQYKLTHINVVVYKKDRYIITLPVSLTFPLEKTARQNSVIDSVLKNSNRIEIISGFVFVFSH